MKHLIKYNESDNISIFSQDVKKVIPKELKIVTSNGDFILKNTDLMINGDLVQIVYYHNTPSKSGDPLSDGEPDYLEFDLHFNKNVNGIKILVDITYGDAMVSEFSIEVPNKVNIIHYTGIRSKYDPETIFSFSDESIHNLVEFFNSFSHGIKLTTNDLNFLDKDNDSYNHNINDKEHLYTDDSDLIEFGNKFENKKNKIVMKHIKTINEYQRTVGFRYSEPKEKFNIKIYLDNQLSKEEIELALNESDVIFSDIKFEDTPDDISSDDQMISVISFDVNVYNEKELERIVEDFSKIIHLDYGVKTLEVFIKPKRS